jgi:hypothetical protein
MREVLGFLGRLQRRDHFHAQSSAVVTGNARRGR